MEQRTGTKTSWMKKEKDEEAMGVMKAVPIKRKADRCGEEIVGWKARKSAPFQKTYHTTKSEKIHIEEADKENCFAADGSNILQNILINQRTQRDGTALQAFLPDTQSDNRLDAETSGREIYYPEFSVAFHNIRNELNISEAAWNEAILNNRKVWMREVFKWNQTRGPNDKLLIILDFQGKDLPKFQFISQNTFTTRVEGWIKQLQNTRKVTKCQCNCKAVCDKCLKVEKKTPQVRVQPNGLFSLEGREHQNLCQAVLWSAICDGTCGIENCPQSMKTLREYPIIIYNEDGPLSWSARAATSIPAGAKVSEYVGETLTTTGANRRSKMHQFEVGAYFAVDAGQKGNEARFLSHACVPNCRIIAVFDKGASLVGLHYRLFIITLRAIQPGERLTIDYHAGSLKMYEGNRPEKSIDCKCGTHPCRKYIAIC